MVGMVIRVKDLNTKIEARDRQIAKLEAQLKEKRRELAAEIVAHNRTTDALRQALERLVRSAPLKGE
jgi:predicted  nucleic acid-binding Zn-ribbon protein